MTGDPAELRALALAVPRTQQRETWLPVSGCCAFMSGNAFVLAASLSPSSLPSSPPSYSAAPRTRVEDKSAFCRRLGLRGADDSAVKESVQVLLLPAVG